MTPYYEHAGITIYHGDCREVLPGLGGGGTLLTDPPYASAAATATTGRSKSVWGSSWGDMSLVNLMTDTTIDAAEPSEVFWEVGAHPQFLAVPYDRLNKGKSAKERRENRRIAEVIAEPRGSVRGGDSVRAAERLFGGGE